MGYHLQGKTKSARASTSIRMGLAQALVSLDAGSGAGKIFTLLSCPQRLHLHGTLQQLVSGFTFSSFPFLQIGQITHPFTTDSLTGCCASFNAFPSLSFKRALFSTIFQD